MTYATMRNGSRGEDVKKLQQKLISEGYDLGKTGADGIYGANTEAAVRAYQKTNNLAADGVAGNQTQSSLYGTESGTSEKSGTLKTGNYASPIQGVSDDIYDRINEQYKPSENVTAALELVKSLQKKINEGTKYSEDLDAIIQKILQRPGFSYNPDEDPLFQQMLAAQKTAGGKAMQDTVAKSSALTGGYANSWAQTAAQQTYNQYVQDAYNQLPQYYQLALSAYTMEGDELMRQYSMLSESDQREFDRLMAEIGVAFDMYDLLSKEDRWAFEGRVGTAKDIAAMMNSDYWKEIERQLMKEANRAQAAARYSGGGGGGGGGGGSQYDAVMNRYLEGLLAAKKNGTQADYINSIKGNLSSAELSALMQAAGLSTSNFSKVTNTPSWSDTKKTLDAFMSSTSFANMTAREQQNALKRLLKNYENTDLYNTVKNYLHL